MNRPEKLRIIEALVLASPEPISSSRLAAIVPDCSAADAKDLVNELNTEYQNQDRAFEIWEVAGGYQIRTRAEFSGYLQQLHKQRPLRLSRAALDTLSIVSYKQPVTRAEIEEIRGVDTGAVLKGLLDRHLVRIAGQREVPGRPMLYATTRRFLEVFGLESLKHLPSLREVNDLAEQEPVAPAQSEGSEISEHGQAVDESLDASEPNASEHATAAADLDRPQPETPPEAQDVEEAPDQPSESTAPAASGERERSQP
jgi:segregation and condensation protein B